MSSGIHPLSGKPSTSKPAAKTGTGSLSERLKRSKAAPSLTSGKLGEQVDADEEIEDEEIVGDEEGIYDGENIDDDETINDDETIDDEDESVYEGFEDLL